MIYFICGKGGTGKDTIANKVLDKYMFLERIVLDTTRPIRKNEVNGVNYNFISDNEFEKNIFKEKYIEYREYETAFGTWKYGTSTDYLDKNCVIVGPFDMYIRFLSGMDRFYGKDNITGIYLEASSIDRLNRMINRLGDNLSDDSVDEVCRRVYFDDVEFEKNQSYFSSGMDIFKLVINTSKCNLDSTLHKVYSLINRVH